MAASHQSILLALVLSLLALGVDGDTDVKAILTRAANDFASSVGTSITKGTLADGLCFARSDPTNNKDTCTNQPQEFNFLNYGTPQLGAVTAGEPTIGPKQTSTITCPTPTGGTPTTCTVGNSNAKATSTSVANTEAFSTTIGVTATVNFGAPPLAGGSFAATTSFSVETSTTTTKTSQETNTQTASTSITVAPGSCKNLLITSTPNTKEGTVKYTVGITGAVSMWFADSKNIPGGDGSHYNWNVPVTTLVTLAVKGGYAGGLSVSGNGVVYTGSIKITEISFPSSVQQVDCGSTTATPVTGSPASPTPTTPSTGGSSGGTYTVKTGDTLSAIASARGTTVAAIQAANPSITNPDVIDVGQVINIPTAQTGRKMLK